MIPNWSDEVAGLRVVGLMIHFFFRDNAPMLLFFVSVFVFGSYYYSQLLTITYYGYLSRARRKSRSADRYPMGYPTTIEYTPRFSIMSIRIVCMLVQCE